MKDVYVDYIQLCINYAKEQNPASDGNLYDYIRNY